jgi:hypothetical protein
MNVARTFVVSINGKRLNVTGVATWKKERPERIISSTDSSRGHFDSFHLEE